ncbi:MAG: hydrogenase subunit MbhD domain-containing protein [Rhodobacterales bacterium]
MILFDLVLCALILTVALVTVAGRGTFRAIVFFIVYGLFLSIAWVRLGAVDVALAEAAIGAGLTAVLFLAGVGRLRRAGDQPERPVAHHPVAALACGGLAAVLGWAWFALPLPDRPDPQLTQALPLSGAQNPVTAVLLNFRAWDTLLESVVLFAALIGIWILTRDQNWSARIGLPQHVRPGGVLSGFGRVLPPVGLLVGIYLVYAGTSRPGGAFQGGTVLAAVGLVAAMAGAIQPPRVTATGWRIALIIGPLAFLMAGVAGAILGAGFLVLPPGIAGIAILAIEVVLTVSIAVTLAFLVLGPPAHEAQG